MRAAAALLALAAAPALAQAAAPPVANEMDMELSAPDPATPMATGPGNAPAPPAPADHWADRFFAPADMAAARQALYAEHGETRVAQLMINIAEAQLGNGDAGYHWDGEALFGSDLNRLVVKSEGEGAATLESAEVQALYSRALDPYWNLQIGLRHDFAPTPAANYAAFGIEGLAPYWFELSAAGFVSGDGDVLGRLTASYDQRITQKLILQPRVELNFAAQDMPAQAIGAGLSSAELALRLRYEITRKFAPYIGIAFDGTTGQTARYRRADGEAPAETRLVLGIRSWF